MNNAEITEAINAHTRWRRQFLNAFAGGSYADMPLSEHRGCLLEWQLGRLGERLAGFAERERLVAAHTRFHALAGEIVELSENGMAASADLLLPQLTEASYLVLQHLGDLRDYLAAENRTS